MMKPAQARMARAALKWSLLELEQKSGVNKNTIVRFEAGKGILHTTAIRLEDAFTKAGISFIYEDETRGSGVLLSKEFSRRIGETSQATAKGNATKRKVKAK
jgi:transcriptional regulator with XRE-family HTH domain